MKTVQFIGISPEELQAKILNGIQEQIKQLKKDLPRNYSTEYLTRVDVAEMLQINLSTLYNWTKKGKLISYGIGNRVYYKKDEVEKAIIRLNS